MRDKVRENTTVRAMAEIYCKGNHTAEARGGNVLCPECEEVMRYAEERIAHCPKGENKTTCGKCEIHCYKPAMREKIRTIMRYAGPRMMLHHPAMALRHMRGKD